jgi:hypothetical protein
MTVSAIVAARSTCMPVGPGGHQVVRFVVLGLATPTGSVALCLSRKETLDLIDVTTRNVLTSDVFIMTLEKSVIK